MTTETSIVDADPQRFFSKSSSLILLEHLIESYYLYRPALKYNQVTVFRFELQS